MRLLKRLPFVIIGTLLSLSLALQTQQTHDDIFDDDDNDDEDNITCTRWCALPENWGLDDGPCIDLRQMPTMRSAYEQAVRHLEGFYAFGDWKSLDWEQVILPSGLESAVLADETGDLSYMHLAAAQLKASIPDGHIEYDAADVCGAEARTISEDLKYAHIGGGFGITVAGLENGETIITSVTSEAVAPHISVGDVVNTIDGIPALDAVKAQGANGWMWAANNPATTKNRLVEQFRAIVRAPVGTNRKWGVTGSNTTTLEVNLTAEDDAFLTWNLTKPTSNFYPTVHAAQVHYRRLPENIGYIGIGEEEVHHMELKFATALTSLKGVRGIVLDLRGNDGGEDDQGAAVVNFFLPEGSATQLYEQASYSNRLLNVAKNGSLREFINGGLDDWSVVPDSAGGSDGSLYNQPIDTTLYQTYLRDFPGPFTGPVVCLINSYCDSTCEGIAKGIADLDPSRSAVVGFDGTLGSFGMSGGTIVLPGDIEFSFPFGRSVDAENRIQLDSDWTGKGGVLPTVRLVRNSTNAIAFVQQKLNSRSQRDVELEWAVAVMNNLTESYAYYRSGTPSKDEASSLALAIGASVAAGLFLLSIAIIVIRAEQKKNMESKTIGSRFLELVKGDPPPIKFQHVETEDFDDETEEDEEETVTV